MASSRVQKLLAQAADPSPAERSDLSEGLRALSPGGDSRGAGGWDARLGLSGAVESGDPDVAQDKHSQLAASLDRR